MPDLLQPEGVDECAHGAELDEQLAVDFVARHLDEVREGGVAGLKIAAAYLGRGRFVRRFQWWW